MWGSRCVVGRWLKGDGCRGMVVDGVGTSEKDKHHTPHTQTPHTYTDLCMEFVVAEVQRGVDWTEWFKINVDLLFFAFISDNCSTVDHETIWGY